MEIRISAVIITFNEERDIKRCLESLVGVADEIVVVDSYSNDRTEEICKTFNVKFIKHRFFGHIEQKNWALLQASSPYILSLDADECLSDELRKSILEVKKEWTHDGYNFNRLDKYCGKWIRHTSWYPNRKLRLWDARKGQWGGINPHDKFKLYEGCSQKHLKGDLLHYSYYSISEHLQQMDKFSTIRSEAFFDLGKRITFFGIIFHSLWRFIKEYVLKTGFLDGYYGYVISVNSAYEVYLKYSKLKGLYLQKKRDQKQTICLFNSESDWGGGEKWHADVASHLLEKGYRVFFITSPGSPLYVKMKGNGAPGYQIKFTNLSFINPFKVLRLARIFRKEKVGSLLTSLPSDMKVASVAARLAGVQKIIYRRGSAIPIRNVRLNRYLLRRVVTQIIANSLEVKKTILANNSQMVPEKKISVIYNGVSKNWHQRDNPPLYLAKDQEIVLGSAGRFSEEKGHLNLISLMKVLGESSFRFKLLIAGKGKLQEILHEKAREEGVEDQVEFLGFVEDMTTFYNSIDIFLLPSRYEGFSNVVLEAMVSAKPVVSFDVGSVNEVIDHGKTGLVGKSNSVDEMSRLILDLAADKSRREEMGNKARERIETSFSFEQNMNEVITLVTRNKD